MNGANLPQLVGASDLAAAAELTRRPSRDPAVVAEAGRRLGQLVAGMQSAPPAPQLVEPDPSVDADWLVPADVVDQVVDDPCSCPPAYICSSSCEHCAGLADDVPCPHDLDPPAPALADVIDCGPLQLLGPVPALDYAGPLPAVVDEVTVVTPAMAAEVADVEAARSARVEAAREAERIEAELVRVEAELAQARLDRDQAAGVAVEALPAGKPSTGSLPSLDWRGRHDIRSLAYGVREHLLAAGEPLQLGNVLLPIGPVLDQGSEGQCVGMAVVAAANVHDELGGNLDQLLLGQDDADQLYRRAQLLDDRPGEGYTGTSVLAGMKAATEAGLWHRYLWSFGTRDLAGAIMRRRPVVVGIPWLSGMYETGPGGRVDVVGDDGGLGHCLVVVGLRLAGPQGQPGPWFVWQNSWGTDYGDDGLGYVHHRDLARLLRSHGEAAVPLPPGADW